MAYKVCFRTRANHEQGTEGDKQESMREAVVTLEIVNSRSMSWSFYAFHDIDQNS